MPEIKFAMALPFFLSRTEEEKERVGGLHEEHTP